MIQLLSRSRRVSNFFNFSIARWAQKQMNLVYRNAIVNTCASDELEVPSKNKGSENFTPALDKKSLARCLNISDVRELAHFELPTFSNPAELQGRVQSGVQISPGSLPEDLFTASVVAQFLLFFALMHFTAYASEAVSSPQFPVRGTLLCFFAIALDSVCVISCRLEPAGCICMSRCDSRKWALVACSVLIFGAVVLVYLTLQRKSYFTFKRPESLVPTKVHENTQIANPPLAATFSPQEEIQDRGTNKEGGGRKRTRSRSRLNKIVVHHLRFAFFSVHLGQRV